jgi:SNF2 family DNA or RNA helicase
MDSQTSTTAEIETLKAELNRKQFERETLLEEIKMERESIDALNTEIRRIRREADEKITALADEQRIFEDTIWQKRKAIAQIDKEIAVLQQKLQLAMDALLQSDKFRHKAEEFNRVTAGAPWREWAFDYQMDGARLMATNARTINADKMGLGKSIQALMACDMVQSERVLILGPASVANNFLKEVKKWAPNRIPINMNAMNKVERMATINLMKNLGGPVCVIVNYEAWRKDMQFVEALVQMRFDTVICDEFHFVKDPNTIAARGVERLVLANNICPKCSAPVVEAKSGMFWWSECSKCTWRAQENNATRHQIADRRSVKNVFPLSGTPVLNRPDELYFALHLILPEIFYDVNVFRSAYCVMVDGKWRWGYGGISKLEKHLAGHYVSRTKKDVGINLPPQTPVIVELDFDTEKYPEQWRIMNMIHEHAQIALKDGSSSAMTEVIAIITRKRQANVCPAGIKIWEPIKDENGKTIDKKLILDVSTETTESIKLDYATELIEGVTEGEQGERVIVFSQFKEPLREMHRRLERLGISSVVMDGDTSRETKNAIELDWDRTTCSENDYAHQVLLTNYKTGGTGLNLTAATQIVILDEPWNPGTMDQALDRVNRIGQTAASTVTIIRIKNSIDDWLADLLAAKSELVNDFEVSGRELTQSIIMAMENGDIF